MNAKIRKQKQKQKQKNNVLYVAGTQTEYLHLFAFICGQNAFLYT